MSVYNIIIWSLNDWGIKFEMLNHGEHLRATVKQGRVGTVYSGKYEFQIKHGSTIFVIIPDPDSLKVQVNVWRSRLHKQKHIFDLHDPESLPKLKEILCKS